MWDNYDLREFCGKKLNDFDIDEEDYKLINNIKIPRVEIEKLRKISKELSGDKKFILAQWIKLSVKFMIKFYDQK